MKNAIKNMTTKASVAAGLLVLATNVFATGTSAAQFLKLGVGARAAAMGEAYSSVANDVTAAYWNPAGLAQVESIEIGAMQNTHFVDTQYQYLAGALPTENSVFALSFYRLDYGTIDRYTNTDVKDGSFNAGSMAANLSMGRKFGENLMLGATLKHVSETIETSKASSIAADLGAIYKLEKINLSAVIQHIGPAMKMVKESAPLPMTIRLGASKNFFNEKMIGALEISKPNDANVSIHAGMDYQVTKMLALRGGYTTTPGQSTDLGGLVGLNAGLGMSFNRFNIDYAVSPFGDLGLSHKFSIGYKFGTTNNY